MTRYCSSFVLAQFEILDSGAISSTRLIYKQKDKRKGKGKGKGKFLVVVPTNIYFMNHNMKLIIDSSLPNLRLQSSNGSEQQYNDGNGIAQ